MAVATEGLEKLEDMALGLDARRIQFTPDLMPSDILDERGRVK